MDFKKTSDSGDYISQTDYSFSSCSKVTAVLCIFLTIVVLAIFSAVFVVYKLWPMFANQSDVNYKCQTTRVSFAVVAVHL